MGGISTTTGKVGLGVVGGVGGSGKWIEGGPSMYDMISGSATSTVSYWVNRASFGGAPMQFDGQTNLALGYISEMGQTGDGKMYWGSGGTVRTYTGTPLTASSIWYHIALVKTASGDNGNYYINGILQTTYTGTLSDIPSGGGGSRLFAYHTTGCGSGNYCEFDGIMDEFRVSSAARSAAWVLTEYNNQNAPGNIGADNFLKYGAESMPPSVGGTIRHRVAGGE
jgi:hypothetical protein